MVDRSGKSHPPRVKACHHRRCTGAGVVASTGWGRVVVAVVVDAVVEGETERRDESSGKYEGLQGERSHHRQDHIGVVGEEKDGERMGGIVAGDGSRAGRDLEASLVGLDDQGIGR